MKKGRPKEDIYEKYVKGKEDKIVSWCRSGADNKILAKKLGCGLTTITSLIRKYPTLKAIIRESKEDADLAVESALYKRAIGYEFEEITTEVLVDKDGNDTTTMVKKVKKHIASDVGAAAFWLKNRKGDVWRERQDVNVSVNPFEELLKEVGKIDGE